MGQKVSWRSLLDGKRCLFVCFRCSIRSGGATSDLPADTDISDYQADEQADRIDCGADEQANITVCCEKNRFDLQFAVTTIYIDIFQ